MSLEQFPTFADLHRIINADGFALSTYAAQPVNGCNVCGNEQGHWNHAGRRPLHAYALPTDHLRKLRILARRHLADTIAEYRREYAQVIAELDARNAEGIPLDQSGHLVTKAWLYC